MWLLARITPSLLSLAFVLAVALGDGPLVRPADTSAEAHSLHQQIDALRLRLRILEVPPPPAGFPRGIGSVPAQKREREPKSAPA